MSKNVSEMIRLFYREKSARFRGLDLKMGKSTIDTLESKIDPFTCVLYSKKRTINALFTNTHNTLLNHRRYYKQYTPVWGICLFKCFNF